jgi:hypothetical protein
MLFWQSGRAWPFTHLQTQSGWLGAGADRLRMVLRTIAPGYLRYRRMISIYKSDVTTGQECGKRRSQ